MKFKMLLSIPVIMLFIACSKDDDSNPPTVNFPDLEIENITVDEGDDNSTISFTVELRGEHEATATVQYKSVDQTAVGGEDFEATEGVLTFEPGITAQTIDITILGDHDVEENESFELVFSNPVNIDIITDRATVLLNNDDVDLGYTIPDDGYSTPDNYAGYTLVWQDEFNDSTLNQDDWNYEIGNGSNGWGNNELQYYTSANTSLVLDDFLVIEAKEESFAGYNYTSSRLTTQNKQSFQYGRVDIRAVVPEGQGIWPALWMLGDDITSVSWPACGEMDIMELVGHEPSKVHATVHFGNDFSVHQYIGSSYSLSNGEKFSEAFHVFSLIWQEDYIQFLVDDQVIHEFTPSGTGNQPYPFNDTFFFIFNVAVGGNWPGSPNASTVFPQRMIVDYIRVFQE